MSSTILHRVSCILVLLVALSAVPPSVAHSVQRANLSHENPSDLSPSYVVPAEVNPYKLTVPVITVQQRLFYGTIADDGVITIVPIATVPIAAYDWLKNNVYTQSANRACDSTKVTAEQYVIPYSHEICVGWHFFGVTIIVILLLCSVI